MKLETKKVEKNGIMLLTHSCVCEWFLQEKITKNVGVDASMCKYRNIYAECSITDAFESDMKHQ